MKGTIYKAGNLRGDKTAYPDGEGCCIWYLFPDSENTGLAFDFPASDIDDFIKLLTALKQAEAEPMDA